MNATDLLEKQHRKVEAIFAKLEDMDGPAEAEELLEELANDLAAHMTIEQRLFYPAVRAVDAELVAESVEEHALAEVALRRLLAADAANTFKARVTALKELIEHHVGEEEEELFPKAEKALDGDKLEELGEAMAELFDEVVEAGYERVLVSGAVRTSADGGQAGQKKTASRRKKPAPARRSKSAA